GGGRPNWRGADHGNYAEEDEMEDIFMIEEDLPVTSCPDDEDTWWQIDVDPAIELETDDVSIELCQYSTDETDECNAATAAYVREAIIDSGATEHMTGDIDLLFSVVACARRTATFKIVLYVPTLKKTLVSISRINRQSGDASLVFKKDHCQIRNKNKLSITARWNDSYLYAIQGKFILPGMDNKANTAEAADAMLWHALKKAYKVYDLEDKKAVFTVDCTFKETEFHRPRTVFIEDNDDQRDGKRGTMAQVTKEDVAMDLANAQPPPQHSASSMTSDDFGARQEPFKPQTRHEKQPQSRRSGHGNRRANPRRRTTGIALGSIASTLKQETVDVARSHEARATAVEPKRSASRNKIRASATTAQPERKASDRGQSPHKTMRTEGTREVATKVPWKHHIDQDDSFDAANAAYDVCFNATDMVTIYVGDVLVCASDDDEITGVFTHLQQRILLNDLGPISKLLGMEIDRNEGDKSMYVTQRTYIERMAVKYGMDKSKRGLQSIQL
ncbi:hypothetical protein DYB28_007527, partial [Aphanomyces astaci]